MSIVSDEVKARMDRAAQQIGLISVNSPSILGDLADRLLERFPELRTVQARSLGEAIDIVIPWVKSAAVAGIAALAVRVIGAAALALGVKVLLALCVVALALYVVSRVGPPGVQRKLDEIFDRINREFQTGASISQIDLQRGIVLASTQSRTGSRVA